MLCTTMSCFLIIFLIFSTKILYIGKKVDTYEQHWSRYIYNKPTPFVPVDLQNVFFKVFFNWFGLDRFKSALRLHEAWKNTEITYIEICEIELYVVPLNVRTHSRTIECRSHVLVGHFDYWCTGYVKSLTTWKLWYFWYRGMLCFINTHWTI